MSRMGPDRGKAPAAADTGGAGIARSAADEAAARVTSSAAASPVTPAHGDPVMDEVARHDREEPVEPVREDQRRENRPDPSAPAAEPEVPFGEPEAPGGEPEAPVGPAPASLSELADEEHGSARELEELSAKARKAEEYLALAQRTKADFENYRKRAARETATAQERGVAKLAKELLPAVDNLDRALEAAEAEPTSGGEENGGPDSALVSGIKLVHADVIAALSRAGIERFSPHGEPFDPQHHEAVAQQPVPGAESGSIVEVYQSGYRIGDSVLRPARVVVAQ